MKKLILAACLVAGVGISAFAQSSTYDKSEFYVGYANGQIDKGIDTGNSFRDFLNDRTTFHGFEASGVYNFHRYFGVKGDVSGVYNTQKSAFTTPTGNVAFDSNNSLYNFLGGIQVKDNSSDARFKPWAHALVGAGHARTKITNVACTGTVDCTGITGSNSETGWAGAFGGGVDVKLTDKFDLRAIQVDYNPIRFSGQTQQNVRLGIGIVFK
jgi:Opacity protein and related surface antigens